jgi:hypothetical protein
MDQGARMIGATVTEDSTSLNIEKPNHRAEFVGGPVDGQVLWIPKPFQQFGFTMDGFNWVYRLASKGANLRYEFVGSRPHAK